MSWLDKIAHSLQHNAEDAQKLIKKGGKAIKDAAKSAISVGADLPFAPLLPLKPVMVAALDKRNIAHTSHLHDIAPKFVNHIVKGHASFDDSSEAYDITSGVSFYNADEGTGDSGGSSGSSSGMSMTMIGSVIQMVINYFKKLKEKKDAGEPLSAEEQAILAKGEIIAKEVNDVVADAAKDTVAAKVRDFMFSWKGGLALVILVLLLIAAFSKKKAAA